METTIIGLHGDFMLQAAEARGASVDKLFIQLIPDMILHSMLQHPC